MKRLSHFSPWRSPGKLRLAAVVVAAAVPGWWLGLRRSAPAAPRAPAEVVPVSQEESASPGAAPTRSRDAEMPAAVRAWMAEIERESAPSAQAAAAVRLAARLTLAEWAEFRTYASRLESASVREILAAVMLRRQAAEDPASAVEEGLRENNPPLTAVATAEWVRQDPRAAREWFESLTPAQRASGGVQGVFYAALLRSDPAGCMELMLAHEGEPGFWTNGLEDGIAAASPEKALEFAARVAKESWRKSLQEAVAREKSRRDPAAALAWVRGLPDAEKMLPLVFQQFKTPPAGLLPALASLTPEEQKLIHEKSWPWWERGDPFATLEALRAHPEGLTEESLKNMTSRALTTMTERFDYAESARRLTEEFPEMAGKWEARVAKEWSERDAESARRWAESLPEGEGKEKALVACAEGRERAEQARAPKPDPVDDVADRMIRSRDGTESLGSLLGPLTSPQRQAVWERLSSAPEDQRLAAQSSLISLQAGINPAEAAAWLTGAPDAPPAPPELTSRLAANWALDDAPAAARWVNTLPAGESRKWALWNLSRQWSRVDAEAAQKWAAERSHEDRTVMESAFSGEGL